MITNKDDSYFRLTSFYLAAFLFAKGQELVNIDKLTSKRATFVFLDTPEREPLVNAFNFSKQDSSDVLVDARTFIMAIKMLKDKLYQGI